MRTDMTKGVGFDKYWDAGGGESYYYHLTYEPSILMT